MTKEAGITYLQPVSEPVAYQERQTLSVNEWSDWYPCAFRTPDQRTEMTVDHITYQWRPVYDTPPAALLLEQEFGWLLEYRPDTINVNNIYWLGRDLFATADAFKALRFGTKADAEAFLKLFIGLVRTLGNGDDWSAVEHCFVIEAAHNIGEKK